MREFMVPSGTTIKQAMEIIEKARIKICVVDDGAGHALRCVTDGDIRRALLAGASFDAPLFNLPHVDPVVLPQDASKAEMVATMRQHSIQALVLQDAEGRAVKLVALSDLERSILLSPPHMSQDEMPLVQQAFEDNWVAPAGPHLAQFETEMSRLSHRKHAVALSSGTAGLHLALRVLDIGAGDRIYVSDVTFIASVQPILYENATPVLIDSEPLSWNMSPAALRRALAQDAARGQLPKAVVVAHIYGQSADMAAIMEACAPYDIPVIEDAAESLGASYGNRPSGAHGLMSVYSFNGNKIVTTSGGGALVSDRADLIERARNLSQQGRDPADHYQHSQIAYNYRMSNILAGIGIAQLGVLEQRVSQRRDIFARYQQGLAKIRGISFQADAAGSVGNRWLTVIVLDPDQIDRHPYQFMRALRQRGIETRPAWKPMHMQPLLHGCQFVPHDPETPVSAPLFLRSLCLPSGSSLQPEDQDRVISAICNLANEA